MIKKLLLTEVFVLLFLFANSQGFSDNFSDGNFTANPIWSGETAKFLVNTNGQLQLNDQGPSSPGFLVTPSTVISNASWEFYAHFDFAPSASNYGRVYLVSDNSNLNGSLNGYYVKIGGVSGTVDDVSLYKQNGTSSTLLIDGTDGTVGTDPVDLKIRVTRDSSGKWELYTDLTATGNSYNSEGFMIDNSITQSQYFGVLCNYTSTRSDKFFFDDFVVTGQGFQDTTAPVISQLIVNSNTELELSFNEKLDTITAKITSNYLVNKGIGNPSSVILNSDSTKVTLSFSNPFVNEEEYELEVKNVADQNMNPMQLDTLDFLYFEPVLANYRDIVINEFMADPTPPNSLPNAEFIELFNASNKVFDLNGWTLGEGSSVATLSSVILKPNEFIIICKQSDENLFSSFGNIQGQSTFSTLTNGGDRITLSDPNGIIIDDLNYDLSWYKDGNKDDGGWSIEQINPFTNCTGNSNFMASNSNAGGTPGTQNSVFDTLPDLTPPELLNAIAISSDSVLLNFNEVLDSTNTTLIANYSFNTSATIAQVRNQNPEYTSVLLILGTPLEEGIINEITVSNITDCAGNLIGFNNTANIVIPAQANFREIVINEIYADPTPSNGLPEVEFIELYNASNKIFELDGWTIGGATTTPNINQRIFSPGEYLIIISQGNEASFSTYGNTMGLSSLPTLGNTGDEIFLKDPSGQVIDQVFYSNTWYGNSLKSDGGYSLEQINPQKTCTGQNNFSASNANIGGTPGTINSVNDNSPDVTGPVILNVFVVAEDSLLIEFDESISSKSLDSAEFIFSNSNMVLRSNLYEPENLKIGLELMNQLDSGELFTLSVKYVADCENNLIQESNQTELALPEIADSNDIVINEILFNPKSGGDDYVELYNRSKKVISLENWKLANFNDSITNPKSVAEKAVLLFPNQYIVFTTDADFVINNYPFAIAERIFEIESMPSYSNEEGSVYILDQNNNVIDNVNYTDDMHFALLQDADGVSLERLDPNRASNDVGNFHSAAENQGFGTPGYLNSQYFAETKFSGKVTVDPELFSPDNDGFEDIVNINYEFDAPGFVANVIIYDEQGRVIKTLVKNELLGAKGSISWNGITDDGIKARIGIYLIFFEAFNTSGDKEIFKKPCVVAGQLK